MNELLSAALRYVAEGFAVLPLHSGRDGGCTCGRGNCSSPGKHPRTQHGVLDASTNPEQVQAWWALWPDANIGIATGNGLVVIDVDPRNGGSEHMSALGLTTSRTRMAVTGGGGWHLWFRTSAKVHSTKLAPGIDFQAEGKYVVAPPSVHASGDRYEWLNPGEPLEELPARLLTGPKPEPNATGNGAKPPTGSVILPTRSLWVANLFQDGYQVPEGQRNDTLTRLAGYMRVTWPYELTLAVLKDWNRRHCSPPLSDREVEQCVAHKYRRYAGYEDVQAQAWTAESLLLADLPEPVMIVEDIIPVGLTFLAGRSKIGKSWFMLQLALAIATGQPFMGKRVDPGKVVYLALEDSPLRLQKRLKALKAPLTRDITFLTEFPTLDEGGARDLQEIFEQRPKVVILDTFARISGGIDPNKTQEVTRALGPLQKSAHEYDLGLIVVDHHRKANEQRARDIREDISGSIAKGGVADAIWGLYREFGQSKGELAGLGRDVEEKEFSVEWDALTFRWKLNGEVVELKRQAEYERVLHLVDEYGEIDRNTVIQQLKVSYDKAERLLSEITAKGLLTQETVRLAASGGRKSVYRRPAIAEKPIANRETLRGANE